MLHSFWEDAAAGSTHRVCDNVGEERRFLIEAAEDQLTDHQAEVEVERGESQLVGHFALKCKTRAHAFRHVASVPCQAVCSHAGKLVTGIMYESFSPYSALLVSEWTFC